MSDVELRTSETNASHRRLRHNGRNHPAVRVTRTYRHLRRSPFRPIAGVLALLPGAPAYQASVTCLKCQPDLIPAVRAALLDLFAAG